MNNIIKYAVIAIVGLVFPHVVPVFALEQQAEVQPPVSNKMIIDGLLFKNEIRAQDMPALVKTASTNKTTQDDVPCKGEWFAFDKDDYLISRTTCADRALAYIVFRITVRKGTKANIAFAVGFYDFKGKGVFERINDSKDRPLPEWVKEHYAGILKEKIAKYLGADANDKSSPTDEAYLELASEMLERKEFDTVIQLASKAISLKYNHHRLYEIRAYAYQGTRQFEQALADTETALNADQKCFVPYYIQGEVYGQLEQYDKAIAAFTRAIELKPELYDAYRGRGVIYAKIGKRKEAITDFTMTIGLHPNDCCAYLKRGWQYMDRGDYDLALEDYTQAIKVNPGFGYLERGSAYYRLGKYKEAVEDFKKAIEKRPDYDYPRLYTLVTAKRISEDMWKTAMEEQKSYILASKSSEWSRTLLKYVLGLGGFTEEDLLAAAAKGKNPTEINGQKCEAYYFIGEQMEWKGDRKGALEYFKKSIDTRASDYIEYGNAEALLKRTREDASAIVTR